MVPFFFGERASLYGSYHRPPEGASGPETALVICQGIGHEYMRAYRACWQIAEAAAARNAHVLRFDYRGTGDSHGRQHDASWSAWIDSTVAAMAWLRETTALTHIRVLGMRAGALIAAAAAARDSERQRVLFWDPVVNGEAYLGDIADMHESHTRNMNRYRPRRHHHAERGADEYLGFHWPEAVVAGIRDADLMAYAASRIDDWHLVLSDGEQAPALAESITARGGHVLDLPETMDWADIRAQYRRVALPRSTHDVLNLLLA